MVCHRSLTTRFILRVASKPCYVCFVTSRFAVLDAHSRSIYEKSRQRCIMKKSLGAKALAFPTPVWIVGSYNEDGRANAMTASWAGICCSKPPCVYVSLRKATCTHGNISRHKAFTVNIPSEDQAALADYLGLSSGHTSDKFEKSGLTPLKSELVDAPYIKECSLVLECRLTQIVELGLHTQFVGEIADIKADEAVLDDAGMPIVERIRPFLFFPEIMTYHAVGKELGHAFAIGREVVR